MNVCSALLFLVYDQLKQDPVKERLLVLFSIEGDDPVINFLKKVGFGFGPLRRNDGSRRVRSRTPSSCRTSSARSTSCKMMARGCPRPSRSLVSVVS
jgi:hypothetical protein